MQGWVPFEVDGLTIARRLAYLHLQNSTSFADGGPSARSPLPLPAAPPVLALASAPPPAGDLPFQMRLAARYFWRAPRCTADGQERGAREVQREREKLGLRGGRVGVRVSARG